MWNFGTTSIFGGVSFNNNSGYNSDLNNERRPFRKTELDNEEGFLNLRGNTLADIIEEVPEVDCFSKTTLASTCEKMKKASEEIRKTFAGINDTSNNLATVMAGLPKMAIINGNCQGRNIHVFCPETDDCYLKPSDILSLPSKMVTDTAFQFIPIKYPLVEESYESNQMYPGFPLEMLQPQLMFAEIPELKKRSQIYFRDTKKQKLQGNNKVSLKNYDQQNTKKYDELTNSNLNIREPAEHIVDCWSDDGQNKKYVKHSFNKKCKVIPRNRKPSPWKLFGKSRPKAKIKCQKQSEKEEILRRTLSCTVDGNEGNVSGNDEYIPIPIKLTKFFHSLPACGSQGINKSNWIGVHMDDFEDSNSWDSKINPLEFNCGMNKKKIMKKKMHHPEHPNKPVAKPRKQKYVKPSGYELDTNSESSSIAKSESSRQPPEKYYVRESYHPKDEKAFRCYQPSNPNHYYKIKKPYHEQNRKGWQNALKNCFKLKVHGSRAYLEPVQKENRKKIYDRESMTFLKVLPPSEEATESYMKSESVASKIYQNHSSEEYLFKELVKIPDEFLKKSDHLSKQINVVENHVRNLEKLLTYQYHSELSAQLNLSKTDVPCTSLDNKASKTSNSGFNITHPIKQKPLKKIDLSPSDPLDLKAFSSLQNGGLEFCKNISVQELQSLFDNYLEKLQKICMTTEHTKDICSLILDIISKPDFKKVKLSSYGDEVIFKNDVLGLSNEMTLPPKNMQRNNHSRISDTTFDSSDLSITYSVVDLTKTADKENASSFQSRFQSDIFRDYKLNKLSNNNNAPFRKIKYTKKGSTSPPQTRTSNSKQRNRCSYYFLKSFKINDVEKKGKLICRSCCNNYDCSSLFDGINNNYKRYSAKCLKIGNRQNLRRLVQSDSMLFKPRNKSTTSFDSLSSCQDELNSSSNERSSSFCSDSASECFDSSCSNDARPKNNSPNNTDYFPKSNYCYVSCCKTGIPSERFFGLHSNESSVSHGSRLKRRSFFEISINNHNKKIEHPTKLSLNDSNHTQFKTNILNEHHTDEFGMTCEIQNNVTTNKYEQENSELATKDTKSDISFPTGTWLSLAAKNLPSKNLYLSLSDIQKLEEDEDDSKICDFFANDSKSSFKIKADSSSSSVSRRESFYSAMSCSSKKCPEVNSTIDSNSSLENNDSASSMLNYETLTFYSKLISPPHKSSVFTNANFFRESELLPQRTLSTYENMKDNCKLKNPQKILKKGNKLGLFDWIVEQRKDFNSRNGVAFVADERSGTSAIALSKNVGANRPPVDVCSIALKDRLRNFTEIQSMPENDSMFSAKEEMNNVDSGAHFVLDDKNNARPAVDLRGSDMFSPVGVTGRDEHISTIENIRNKEDSLSSTQFVNITETVIPLFQNYFGEVKANCCSDDLNFNEAIVESVGFDVTSSAGVSESSNLSSNFEYIRKNDDIWNSSKSLKTINTFGMLPEEKIDLDVNAQYAGDDVNCFEPNFESLQTILVCGTFDSEQTIDVEGSNIKETPTKSNLLYSPEFLEHDSVLNTTGSCEKFTENVQRYKIHERENFGNISGHEFKNYFQIHSPNPDEDVIGGGDSEEQNKHEPVSSSNIEFHFDALINSSHVEENDKILVKDTDEADIRKSKDIAVVEETVDFPTMIQLPVAELIFFQKLSKTFKDNVDIFDRFYLSNENKKVINIDVGVQHSNDDMIAKIAKESMDNRAVQFVAKLCNAAVQISNNDTASCCQHSLFKSEGEELSLGSETHLSPCEFYENLNILDKKSLLEEKNEVCLIESTLSTAACAKHKTLIKTYKDDGFTNNESLEKPVNNSMDDKLDDVSLRQSNVEANEINSPSKDVSDEAQDKDGQPSLMRECCLNSDEEKICTQAPNKESTSLTNIDQCEIISKKVPVDLKCDLLSNNKLDFPDKSTKVEDCRTIGSAQTEINATAVIESGKCDKEEILKNEILPRSDVEMPEVNQCVVDICKRRAKLYKSKSLSLEIEKKPIDQLKINKNRRAAALLDEAEKMVCKKISSTSLNSSWNTLQYSGNFHDPRSIPDTTCDQSEAGLFSLDNVLFEKKLERENLNESDRTCTVEISLDSKETSTGNSRSLDENFLSLVNVKKLDQSQKELRKHRAIAQRARSKKLFLGIIKDDRSYRSRKRVKENDSIQQERNHELTLFNYNFDTGKIYEQDEMSSEILEIDQSSQMDRKITHVIQARGLKPVCQMKSNSAMKTTDRTRSPNHPLAGLKNSPNRDTTKRPLSSKRVPNIASNRIHSNFKENRISPTCKHGSNRTCDTLTSPNAPSKSDQEIKDTEVECFDMTKLNLHSQKIIKKKLRREKLHSGYEQRDSCHLSRIQHLDEMNMLTISEVDEDITPRKYDMTFKAFENHPKKRCDQAYRRWKDMQKEARHSARESSSKSCWKAPAKSQMLPTKQQIHGKFPQLTHDDERLSANASQSFDVDQQKSFGALRSQVNPKNLKSSASKRVEFAQSMFSNSKSNLQMLLNGVDEDSKENTDTENKQKIEDLEKEIALYKSRICEMKRHIHMKVKHSANGDQESRVKLYGNKNMHQHYEDLLKIFKRKEYGSKVRMNMLRHQSLLSSVRRSCVPYEKSKLQEKSAKAKKKLSRPRHSSCLAEYEKKPTAKSYISSDTFADSLCSTKFTSSGLHGGSFGSRCCETLTKQKDKYETAEVRKLKGSFGRWQRDDCKNRSRRRNEKALGELVQRRNHPEKGNTSCKKIRIIFGHNKKPKFKRSSSSLSTLSSDFLARKLRKPIATRVGPLSEWVRTAFPYTKT